MNHTQEKNLRKSVLFVVSIVKNGYLLQKLLTCDSETSTALKNASIRDFMSPLQKGSLLRYILLLSPLQKGSPLRHILLLSNFFDHSHNPIPKTRPTSHNTLLKSGKS
jgi:hypothetical protein